MNRFTAVFLGLATAATISVMWRSDKWATSVPEVSMCLLAAFWAIVILAGRRRARVSPAMIPLAGIVLWGCIQIWAGTTVYRWTTGLAVLYWLGNLATFAAALQAFADRDLRNRFLKGLTVFGFLLCILCVAQAMTSVGKVYWYFPSVWQIPIFGPFLYYNQFAAFVELLLPVALFHAFTARRNRFWYLLMAATMYGSVLYSGSRGGFVLTTVELLAVPVLAARHRRLSRGQLLNAAGVMALIVLWLAVPAGPDILFRKLGVKDPYAGRREFTLATFPMIRDRPWFGTGLGNWATVYPAYALFDDGLFTNQAHDDWAQWTAEGGIPFLCLMLWLAGWAVPRGLRTGWGVGVPVIFLHCIADYPIQRPGVAIVFFTMLAAVAAASGNNRPEDDERS